MDLSTLQIAALVNAATSAILALALAYLWQLRPDERAPAYWSAALLLMAVRQILTLTAPGGLPPSTFIAGISGALPVLLLYLGALRFVGRPGRPWQLWSLTVAVIGLVAASHTGLLLRQPSLWTLLGLLSFIKFLTALAFLGAARREPEAMHRVLGVLFLLWGVTLLFYPVFGTSPTARPFFALPTSLLIVSTAVALIIATQRRLHLQSLKAQQDLDASNRRFQDFVETATAWVWETDTERRITYVSERIFDSLGIPPVAIIGLRIGQAPGVTGISLSQEELAEIYRPDRPFHDKRLWITLTNGRRVRISHSGKPVFDASGRHIGFRGIAIDITETTRLQAALSAVTSAVAHSVGPDYFRLLVEHLTRDLGVDFALVGQRLAGERIRTLASYGEGGHQPMMTYDLAGTPCALTVSQPLCVVENGAAAEFPRDAVLAELGINGYAGVALRDAKGETIGLIAVMSRQPLKDVELLRTVLSAVAPRAGAELERQIGERALRDSEARFRALIDNMPIGFHMLDAEGRYVLRNRTLDGWSGLEQEKFVGRTMREAAGDRGEHFAAVEAEIREIVISGRPIIREQDFLGLDGSLRPALICRFPIFDSAGRTTFVASFITDLTDLKRLQLQVRENEALLRSVIDNTPMAFQITDPDSRLVLANRTLHEWMGLSDRSLIGNTVRENGVTSKTERIEAEIHEVATTGRSLTYEGTFENPRGASRPALVYRFPIHDSAGRITLVGTVAADLTEIKHLQHQVHQSEARMQRVVSALDLADQGVVVEDAQRRPIYANRTAADLLGIETSALAIIERAGVGGEFANQGSWSGEIIHRTRRGNDAILHASVARLPDGGAVTLLDDATERLERERRQAALERQVLEAQKMDAVGQLAGGIAHDFNNLLGAVLGFSGFILDDTDAESRVHGYAERIQAASRRARDLIQQLLTFSRRENAPRQPAGLTSLIEESAQLLRATLPATLGIEIRNKLPAARALVNPTQVTQILVNLCLNAADAMGGKRGSLILSLDRAAPTEPRLRWLFAADPGSLPKPVPAERADEPNRCYVGALQPGREYLALGVADQGSGIDPDVLARIFDPFFTTKARGQGTGLGLAVVQRLVLAHEGALVISTRPGQGTLFEVLLPLSGQPTEPAEAQPKTAGRTAAPPPSSPKGRILVVDDDHDFGDMVSTALDRAGYEVGVCGRPREALEAVGDKPQLWDVLVTDQTMPEMSGLELIGRLKAMHPGLRCILCTGYASGRVDAVSAAAAGADAFFHKPVEIGDLLASITRLIQPASEARGSREDL